VKVRGLLLASLLVLGACHVRAQHTHDDGGGRDISVALFSTRSVHSVTLAPVGPDAWIAHCARCAHQPLVQPLQLRGAVDLYAGGALRITDDEIHDERSANGLWRLRSAGSHRDLDIVLTIPSERYVAAVLNAEAAPNEPEPSLEALAIVARTYALRERHYTAPPGHLAAEECDSTECQAMHLGRIPDSIASAVRATAGETLWHGDARALVFFGENCGGWTEDAGAVWPNLAHVKYLAGHADPYCTRAGASRWHAEISLEQLASIARREGWRLPTTIVSAQVRERSSSHRALRILFRGADGTTASVSASALRFGIGRALGWNRVRSSAYDLGLRHGALVFDGHGYGNGVGLCQSGAAEMAREGKSMTEILAFYFPGTDVRIQPTDHGWQEANAAALKVRSTMPLTDARRRIVLDAWSEARMRFATPATGHHVQLVFAPTTELFRQLTAQPGWALASTRGNTIVLQPDAVLRANGQTLSPTLLHEMLHVLVESESTERAPLWLREGLVEVLSGETNAKTGARSAGLSDSDLAHPDSLSAARRAHQAAAAAVRALLARYGMSTVRGWLSSGVPPAVASEIRSNSASKDKR
jgi:stage II sporulation protein D